MAAYAEPSSSSSSSSSSSRKPKFTAAKEADDDEPRILPDDVIDKIFSFLPLKSAFSSGLISKRFSNSWKLSRDLSFNVDYRTLGNWNRDPREELFKLVQFVMDEHEGPQIKKLMIILDPSGKEGQVCDWIMKAVSKGVEELDLDFSAGDRRFYFPSNMILLDEENARKLHTLKVCYCELPTLGALVSFGYLKKLSVEDVMVTSFFLKAVFKECLNLETFELCQCECEEEEDRFLIMDAGNLEKFKSLKVDNCSYLLKIYINAPSLEEFYYEGEICRIVFGNELTKIQKVIIHFNPARSICLFPGSDEVMMAVRRTKFLSVSSPILERMCGSFCYDSYKDNYVFLANLEEIRLRLGGSTATPALPLQSTILNPYDIACFFGKCPYIQRLTLDFGVFPLESGPFWEFVGKHSMEKYSARFNSLKAVCLVNFKFFKLEMTIAEFILGSSPALEKCVIVKARRYPGPMNQEMEFVARSLVSDKFVAKIYNHNEPYQPY